MSSLRVFAEPMTELYPDKCRITIAFFKDLLPHLVIVAFAATTTILKAMKTSDLKESLERLKKSRLLLPFSEASGVNRRTLQRILGGDDERKAHPLTIAAIERGLCLKRFKK